MQSGNILTYDLPSIKAYCLIQKGYKKPIGEGWQHNPVSLDDALKALKKGIWNRKQVGAIGLLAGPVSGLVFLDFDGHSVSAMVTEKGWDCPTTLKVSSGRDGHYQLVYRVPESIVDLCTKRPKVIYTGVVVQEYGKEVREQLDIRWGGIDDKGEISGVQSVVIGTHPETGNQYSITEDPIAYAPDWLIQTLLDASDSDQKTEKHIPPKTPKGTVWGDRDWTESYLSAIDVSALDWYEYRNLLLALHSIGFTEGDVLSVSKTSQKHTDRGFSDIWRHIKGRSGYGIAWVGQLAKQHGWVSPFPKPEKVVSITPKMDPVLTESIKEEVNELMQGDRIRLSDILPPNIASMLTQSAKNKPVSPETYLLPFLSIAGGRLGVDTTIDVNGNGWKERPILWTAVALPPGSKKSPVLNELSGPIVKRQAAIHGSYLAELNNWKALEPEVRRDTPMPERQDVVLEDGTLESIVKAVTAPRNRGHITCIYDELGALFAGLNQYKGGRGNDAQVLCKLWNGGLINKRVGQDIHFVEHGGITITGMIQPSVLSKLMESDRDDTTGLWGRFLVSRPVEVAPYWAKGNRVDISEALTALYNRIEGWAGREFKLSRTANTLAENIVNGTAEHWKNCGPREQNIWSKAQGNLFKVALILHCIEYAESGIDAPLEVGPDTLKRAWVLVQYSLKNMECFFRTVWNDDDSELGAEKVAIIDRLRQNSGLATLTQLKRSLRRKIPAERLLKEIGELEALGILTSSKKGKSVILELVTLPDRVQPQGSESAPDFGDSVLDWGETAPEKEGSAPEKEGSAPSSKTEILTQQGIQEEQPQKQGICPTFPDKEKSEKKSNVSDWEQKPLEKGDRVECTGEYFWQVVSVNKGSVVIANGYNPEVVRCVNITEIKPWGYPGDAKTA